MNLDDVTPLILTYNEEANIARALDSLAWAKRVVVVDSGSSDGTSHVVATRDHVEFMQRDFDSHASQWNFGVEQVRTPWVLALDADYVCPQELAAELRELAPSHEAYQAEFTYCIDGRPLRGTLYPARAVLFRADRLRYRQDGHTQLLDVAEPVGALRSVILHDDRKPLARWLVNQAKYADLEVAKLLSAPAESLGWKDRLRKQMVWAPLLTFFYCMFFQGLILDGWPGIYYSLQRTYAELLLSLKLLDARLRRRRTQYVSSVIDESEAILPVGGDSVAEETSYLCALPESASETPPTFEAAPSVERPR
jgi:glycosyltransferase involved in cell wall biosynthesis